MAELQETIAREAERYERLASLYDESQHQRANLHARIDELACRLEAQATTVERLHPLDVALSGDRLRLAQSYTGVVEDVHDDTVVVVYDVDGSIIEQTYVRSQFIGGRLPEVQTRWSST